MGAITQGGWSYTLTPTDKLWAARMVEGEGGAEDAPAVLWTMTQLFTPAGQRTKYGDPHRFRTFTALLQAYSQPINPAWRRDGRFCRPGGEAAGQPNCSESSLARRDRLATLPMSRVDPQKRALVERWFAGKLANPVPSAIEFAAPNVSRSFLSRNPSWIAVTGGGNWFLRPPTPLPRTTIGSSVATTVLVVGGGLALAWFGGRWWRRRTRR